MIYIIDSYAWIEYFIGSDKGTVVRNLFFESNNKFYTVICCLAEVQEWALRNNKDFDDLFKVIRASSSILDITEDNWISAAKEKFEQRKMQKDFGLIDSLILIKQKELSCGVISGDSHFKRLPNVCFLK
jgi:predicted nucleic acid-binding protein